MFTSINLYEKYYKKEDWTLKFVLFLVKSTFVDAIYSELYRDEQVLLYTKMNNPLLDKMRNIHTSMKLNKYFTIPFQGIWKHTFFNENSLYDDEECIFLFEEGNKQAYNQKYLQYIRKKYKKAKLFFLCWNPAEYLQKKYIDFVDSQYNKIVSFDPEDCRKHNWIHYSGIYSRPKDYKKNDNPEYDVLFVGHNKGRLSKLRILYNMLQNAGLKCDFYISEVDKEDCLEDGIHYNEYLMYQDVIYHVQNSKAILEILQDCQHGSTLRPMEAMVYERILITNNKEVKSERYYTDKQFYVFDDMSNIDIEEIVKRCHDISKLTYNGILSPNRFLAFLESQYN